MRSTVSFKHPFTLDSLAGPQPAGEYVILLDDELIEGLSRMAYRNLGTRLQTPSTSSAPHSFQLVAVSQRELDAALLKDRHLTIQ